MLTSMTGIGRASNATDDLSITIEIRTVNNRFFKLNHRLPDLLQPFESEIEKQLRESILRGTVNLSIKCDQHRTGYTGKIDETVLDSYLSQMKLLSESRALKMPQSWSELLALPGLISMNTQNESELTELQTLVRPVLETTLTQAIDQLNEFRRREGELMKQSLEQSLEEIHQQLVAVQDRAPLVVSDYRNRLLERVQDLLKDVETTVEESDLIRETSIHAERCDIHEEITRLGSHLNQFAKQLNTKSSEGRKLDFLCQEMFREINTIGSKANDVTIAHAVVEMKATVEKIRELVQNIE